MCLVVFFIYFKMYFFEYNPITYLEAINKLNHNNLIPFVGSLLVCIQIRSFGPQCDHVIID